MRVRHMALRMEHRIIMSEKKSLIIVGAGGCGREALQWARDANKQGAKWEIKGFIDDDPDALDGVNCDLPVLSSIDAYSICREDRFICCIGNGGARKKISERLRDRGAIFANLIHPTAVIADSSKIGDNVLIYPFSLVSDNAAIGDGCIVNMYSSIAHDAVLGEYCTISAHCDVTGRCRLGDRVFMGTTSSIVPGTMVGDGAYICAGSTVMAGIKSGRKVMGNPAKMIQF